MRNNLLKKCGLSWLYIQQKASQFSEATGIQDFKSSLGLPQKVLNRNGWFYIDLHGEAKEISGEYFNTILKNGIDKTLLTNIK